MNIKEQPEDFRVKELQTFQPSTKGAYLYFLMKKKNKTTLDALETIANALHIPLKYVGFAGTKDKRAITEQYISFFKTNRKNIEHLCFKDITLTYVTHAPDRLNLGNAQGNSFIIIVRDLPKKKKLEITQVKNYFDEQRFGKDKKNHLIGKMIVKKKYKEACAALALKVEKNDYVGTLRKVNKKLLLLYIHSYQSYLWNTLLQTLKHPPKTLPLIGYLNRTKRKNKKTLRNTPTKRKYYTRRLFNAIHARTKLRRKRTRNKHNSKRLYSNLGGRRTPQKQTKSNPNLQPKARSLCYHGRKTAFRQSFINLLS